MMLKCNVSIYTVSKTVRKKGWGGCFTLSTVYKLSDDYVSHLLNGNNFTSWSVPCKSAGQGQEGQKGRES